jgi:hypothetical protein
MLKMVHIYVNPVCPRKSQLSVAREGCRIEDMVPSLSIPVPGRPIFKVIFEASGKYCSDETGAEASFSGLVMIPSGQMIVEQHLPLLLAIVLLAFVAYPPSADPSEDRLAQAWARRNYKKSCEF